MNQILLAGVSFVNLALLAYTLFFIQLVRKKETTKWLYRFLVTGVALDILATSFMIIGSSNGPLTLHGLIGYIALAGMATDLIFLTGFLRVNGLEKKLSKRIYVLSFIFYIYWVSAYITGAFLVM